MQRLIRHQVPAKLPGGAFSVRRCFSTIEPTLIQIPKIHRPLDESYKKTLGNLKINETTRVMYQGFTGKHATANAHQSIDYGTKVVGGVSPNKSGAHMGLPLFRTMTEAVKYLKPDATAVFVAAHYAAGAIKEAIEAEIPLVVAVAEHVPVHDIMEIQSMLKTQSKTRLVGANCPGIINPLTRARIGFMPHPSFLPGRIGIISKSGTLSYEAVSSTTNSGLGQSYVIGVGGDWIAGTTLVDGFQVLLEDEATDGIIIIGEIGGNTEIEVAQMLKEWKGKPKPVMGLIAGLTAREGRVMGHAGAVTGVGDVGAKEKVKAFEDAGIVMVTDPANFGPGMLTLLGGKQPLQRVSGAHLGQARAYHSLASRVPRGPQGPRPISKLQRRALHIQEYQARKLIFEHSPKFLTSRHPIPPQEVQYTFTLALSIDRSSGTPCFFVSSPTSDLAGFVSDYTNTTPPPDVMESIAKYIQLPEIFKEQVFDLLAVLWMIFKESEAYTLELKKVVIDHEGRLIVVGSGEEINGKRGIEFVFDDAAFRSGGRHKELHALRNFASEVASEIEAGRVGISYVKFPGNNANIGTLVNGAGLSMNTCDVIVKQGGHSANFLDTGGKATKDTVKESFRILLQDERVKAILVNIFGGLTLCDMIAEGIIIAFEELAVKIPVVVRLRGTNEELGRKLIRESGLPLYAFDELESAVGKVIDLANGNEGARN